MTPVARSLLDRPEIPALPVLIPAATIAFAFTVLRMQRNGTLSWGRIALSACWCTYGVGLLRSVLFPYPLLIGSARPTEPWTLNLQLVPLVTVPDDPSGMTLNVLLFLPLGVLLPLVLHRATPLRVVAIGFLLSLTVETVQLVGDVTISTGRIADVDDLIGNTAGTALGYALYRIALRGPLIGRLIEAALFSPRRRVDPQPAVEVRRREEPF